MTPALVIAPTSLMTNWSAGAEGSTPDLKVLVLHGPDRKQNFRDIHRLRCDRHLLSTAAARPERCCCSRNFIAPSWTKRSSSKPQDSNTRWLPVDKATPLLPHRHADGKSSRRIVVAVRFGRSGFPRRRSRFRTSFRTPIEKGRSEGGVRWPGASRRFCCAGKEEVVRSCRRKPRSCKTSNWTVASANSMNHSPAMHAKVREEIAKRGLSRATSSFSTRCSSCARPAATRAC